MRYLSIQLLLVFLLLSQVELTAQYLVMGSSNDSTKFEETRLLESVLIEVLIEKNVKVVERLEFQKIIVERQYDMMVDQLISKNDLTSQMKKLGVEGIVIGDIGEETENFIYFNIRVFDIETASIVHASSIKADKIGGRVNYRKLKKLINDSLSSKFNIESNNETEIGFPFPPPSPSARETIPIDSFMQAKKLKNVYDNLINVLNQCEYFEKSVYKIPNGFALVTRIEKINGDGTSKKPPDRWSIKQKSTDKFSISDYIKSLFSSNPGFYRIIVFIVTDVPFSTTSISPSRKEATNWLHKGLNELPKDIGAIHLNREHLCSVLIYEFQSPESGEDAFLMNPSLHTGRTHLIKANIWKHLIDKD